jgi:hypothetical protein
LTDVYLTKLCLEEDRASENLRIVRLYDQEDLYKIDNAKRHIRDVLESSRKGFLRGKAPEVTIRLWHCLLGVDMLEASQSERSD